MYLPISKAVLRLLAASQFIYASLGHPYTVANPTSLLLPGQETQDSSASYADSSGPEPHMQRPRAVRPLDMQKLEGWGDTWVGFVPEPQEQPTWNKQTINDYAQEGHEQVMQRSDGIPVTIVSALWIRGKGVWVASIPHDNGQTLFPSQCPIHAPRLWEVIRLRTNTGTGSTWHAEDMAMFAYESNREHPLLLNLPYPDGAYMATYGRRYTLDPIGFKGPCSGPRTRLTPNCREVLNTLDIHIV